MVEKTIGNKKDDSVTVNYTLADSCNDTTVVGATSSVSWLAATASTPSNHAGIITITATEDGSDVTRYAFVTPSINGEPCDNNRIKVTQSPGEPPTPTCTCTATGHKNPISSTRTTEAVLLGTYSSDCEGTWSAAISSGDNFLTDFEFREDGNIYAKVSVDNVGKQRTSVYTASNGQCFDDFTVVQEGAEQGCEVYVELIGLDEGDTVKLQWNNSTPSDVGNGIHKNTLDSDTGGITAKTFDPQGRYNISPSEVLLTCNDPSRTVTASKITPGCDCDNMKFSADTYSITLEADEGASENINVDYTCEPTISCSETWFTASMQNKVIYVIASSKNPTTSVRNGKILVKDANNSTCKEIDVSQEAGTGCDKPYPRSMKVRVKANSDLVIGGAINLNNLGNDTLTFTYGDESQESIDLAGYQVNAINPGGESVWNPTDSLDNVICTDKPGLEHYEFDGFPESFTVTINNSNYEATQRGGMPNGHYATVDISYYFYLDYEVILDGGDVKFTIVIKQD